MRTMAAAILAEWREGDASFARIMAMPGPDNAYFEDHPAATLAFFQGLHDSMQLIFDVNLKPVIGESDATVRPVLAESRLSGRSQRNIVVTLEALQALYLGEGSAGLGEGSAGLTAVADPKLDRLMRKAFRLTVATAQSIEGPVEKAAADPARRAAVKKLAKQMQALKQIVRDRLAPALGLAVGFNALDGD